MSAAVAIAPIGMEAMPALQSTMAAQSTMATQSNLATAQRTEAQPLFDALVTQLDNVNQRLITADHTLQRVANGEVDNMHQVMISLQETRLAFDLMLQVRNKVLDAYQEIMRMQV